MSILAFLTCWLLFQQSEDVVQEQLRVEYVLIDLIALDGRNQPVLDLSKQDFVVKEGGKTIPVEFFEALDYTLTPLGSPVAAADSADKMSPDEAAPLRHQFIFALDLENVRLVQMRRAFTQLREALQAGAFPHGADFFFYSMESGALTDGFVNRPEAVLAVLNDFEARLSERYKTEINRRSGGNGPVRGTGRASTGPRDLGELESRIDQCLLGLGPGRPDPESLREALTCVGEEVDSYVEGERLTAERVFGELEALTRRFQNQDGLKTLLFISPGFSLEPGQQAPLLAEALVRQVIKGETVFPFASLTRVNSVEDEFRRVTHACIRNRVVFHTFDIFGTVNTSKAMFGLNPGKRNSIAGSYYAASLRNQAAGLELMARESGGFHSPAPSLAKSVGKVVPKLGFQYVLGYPSPSGKPGKYRKIKIKCKRKGVKLHYRRGYFGGR